MVHLVFLALLVFLVLTVSLVLLIPLGLLILLVLMVPGTHWNLLKKISNIPALNRSPYFFISGWNLSYSLFLVSETVSLVALF